MANDGPFFAKDRDALHLALGGSKADDTGKVGRFGVGLKSVFHICEALVYLGADKGILRPGALNPWAGTGEEGDADPIHPDWDQVGDEDLESLHRVANLLLGKFDNGLLQWFPLRRGEHLDRAQDWPYGLGQACPTAEQIGAWFGRSASLALLLAQCGHIRSIEADRVPDPEKLQTRKKLARVVRPALGRDGWVGRHDDDAPTPDRTFGGKIEAGERTWSVLGIEALGLDKLRLRRSADDWPRDPHWQDGRSVLVLRKALAHAAVTVLRPDNGPTKGRGARLRWADSFLSMTTLTRARTQSWRQWEMLRIRQRGTSSCTGISGRLTTGGPSLVSRTMIRERATMLFACIGTARSETSCFFLCFRALSKAPLVISLRTSRDSCWKRSSHHERSEITSRR